MSREAGAIHNVDVALRKGGEMVLDGKVVSYGSDGVGWLIDYSSDESNLSLIFKNFEGLNVPLRVNFFWKGNYLKNVSFESNGRLESCILSQKKSSFEHYPSKMSAILLLKSKLMTPGRFLAAFYCHEPVSRYGAVAGRNMIYFDEKGDLRLNSDLDGGEAYVARYSSRDFAMDGYFKIENERPVVKVNNGGGWQLGEPLLRDLDGEYPWIQFNPDEDKRNHNMAGVCDLRSF